MVLLKTPEEIKIMAEGGKILAKVIKELAKQVKPGVSTIALNRAAEALILKYGCQCSFLGHEGYPACLCASVNEEIVHAIPSERTLKEGDIISLDLGLIYKGFHSDMAVTVAVGKISPQCKKLIKATEESLKKGIKAIKPGKDFKDISSAIQKHIEGRGFGVVKNLCGHGIGRELHEDPQILNYVEKGEPALTIEEGMVLCLEPMAALGSGRIKRGKGGYAYETADGSWAAHFEHTIAVTKRGAKILTVI
jgi:methionyl aminopeptidase